jgi:hypothetical protein
MGALRLIGGVIFYGGIAALAIVACEGSNLTPAERREQRLEDIRKIAQENIDTALWIKSKKTGQCFGYLSTDYYSNDAIHEEYANFIFSDRSKVIGPVDCDKVGVK